MAVQIKEFNTWSTVPMDTGLINGTSHVPFDFLGGVIKAPKPSFACSQNHAYTNTLDATISGSDPILGTMKMEVQTSQNQNCNVQMYSGNYPEACMTGVRGIYYKSRANGYSTQPHIQHVCMIYKNIVTGETVNSTLVHYGNASTKYSMDKYDLTPIGNTGTEWLAHRLVQGYKKDEKTCWQDPNFVWLGVIFNMAVSRVTGASVNAWVEVKKLTPIVDIGLNSNDITRKDNARVVWGNFGKEVSGTLDAPERPTIEMEQP